MSEYYDLIVIGSGPGGASLAQRLAPGGKRILMLERGASHRAYDHSELIRVEEDWT